MTYQQLMKFTLRTSSVKDDKLSRILEEERPHLLQYACYRLGSLEDAEDAVQDLFLQLHSRPSADTAPDHWQRFVYRSLRNLCTDRLRRNHVPLIPLDQLPDMCEEPPSDFDQEVRIILSLLATLPDEQAEVIRLRFYGNKSFAEISLLLDAPLPTIKSRFRYGLEKIKSGLLRSPHLSIHS